jgi:alkanesulfonate monooxygenase SsuD/methylene tetrahydromethanopterin reductase-like flavin-dependent oxidoreductase (luciferase family)
MIYWQPAFSEKEDYPMRIGLQVPSFTWPGGPAEIRTRLADIARTADDAGFASLWVMDHYYQIKGLFGEAYTDPMLEAYTTLGYFAGLTDCFLTTSFTE